MSKKIYDVLPPKMAHKPENTVKSLAVDNKSHAKNHPAKKHHKEALRQKKERHFPLKEVLVGGVTIVFLLCVYAYIKLPKADIQIWPTMATLTLQEKITADKSVTIPDVSANIIPARYLEFQKDISQEFPATGSASNDGKATGTIKIYNKINSLSSFTLIKGTHFLSDSGKYFVTLAKVVIPGAQNKNGKIVAASVNAEVQAEQSGADYNIGASKFSIPKLNGTSYYYSIYGESSDAMTGGHTGKVKKVTSDDIQIAKDILTEKILLDAKNSLKNQLGPDDILLDDAVVSNVTGAASSVKADAIADTFNEQVGVKISALVFKKQDLNTFVNGYILSKLPPDNNFLQKSLTINYNPETVDVQAGKLALNLQLSAKTYQNIDTGDLTDLVSMKSSDQIKQVVDQVYNGKVSELKVNFWPFWVNKSPQDKHRIKVNLYFE